MRRPPERSSSLGHAAYWLALLASVSCAKATDTLEPPDPTPDGSGDAGEASGGVGNSAAGKAGAGGPQMTGGKGGSSPQAFGGTSSSGTGGSTSGGSAAGKGGTTGQAGMGGASGSGGTAGSASGGTVAGGPCEPPSGTTCADASDYCATESYAVGDSVMATCSVNTGGCVQGKRWLFTCDAEGCGAKAPGSSAGEGFWVITQCGP